jgi:hypothetical protein
MKGAVRHATRAEAPEIFLARRRRLPQPADQERTCRIEQTTSGWTIA